MSGLLGRLQRIADIVAALLMGTMFISFIVQVGARYVFNAPVSWADELSVIMGIWAILWATSFCTREGDNIRFDIIYTVVRPTTRRVFDIVTSTALVAIFVVSLPAVWKYVTFMKIEATAAMHIRYDLVFSIYIIFVMAMIVRHVVIFWNAIRGRDQESRPAIPLETE
ncbi:MAG: TRAP transporter small permease subunit [Burkholderiales bacterium]|nr:TRAP transporter small permease subunit [Burkholderiales bacterium]